MTKKDILFAIVTAIVMIAFVGLFVVSLKHFASSNDVEKEIGSKMVEIPVSEEMTGQARDDGAENARIVEKTKADDREEKDFLNMSLVLSEEDYTYYGVLRMVHTLVGNNNIAVASFEPVGYYDDSSDWETIFIASEALSAIGEPTSVNEEGVKHWRDDVANPRYFKLRMRNCADGASYLVKLPPVAVEAEEISRDDVPDWGGV